MNKDTNEKRAAYNPSEEDRETIFKYLGEAKRQLRNNINDLFEQKKQEKERITTVDECSVQWMNINKKYDLQTLHKKMGERAQQRTVRKKAVERSNTIQNAYFAAGGIYHQLDRLSESFEMAEVTGQKLAVGVVFTILLELDHDLKKLANKLKSLEQAENGSPELERQDQQILDLWFSAGKSMSQLDTLKLEELTRLKDAMEELDRQLQNWNGDELSLPDFPEGKESEELWQLLQELSAEVNPESLGCDVESAEGQARIQMQAQRVRQFSEAKILPRWNRYSEGPAE